MSEPNKDLKRIRAIRSGNRGVVTKYCKEAIELLDQGNETNKDRLRTIANLLNEKIIRLKELDAQVLELCEIDDIEREIEETEEMFSRASDVSSRIEKFTSATGKVIDKHGPTTSKTREINSDVVSNEGKSQSNDEQLQVETSSNHESNQVETLSSHESNQVETSSSHESNQVEASSNAINASAVQPVLQPASTVHYAPAIKLPQIGTTVIQRRYYKLSNFLGKFPERCTPKFVFNKH